MAGFVWGRWPVLGQRPPESPPGPDRGMVLVPADALAPLPEGLTTEERRDIEVFRRAAPSVVYITSIAIRRQPFSLDLLQIPQGTGSGFVWDRDGHVVTNFHVIQQGDAFAVGLGDQSEWEATVAGTAPDRDLAVLRIKAPSRSSLLSPAVARTTSSSASACSPWATRSGSTTRSPSGW